MADMTEATKDKILQSAKLEFLDKGFTSASLRTIAGNAGLTTGAMYRHFKDKDALFCALVDDAIDNTMTLVKAGSIESHRDLKDAVGEEHAEDERRMTLEFIDYIYENLDAFTLLLTKSAGSTHEKFLEEVCNVYTDNIIQTVHWMKQKYNITKPIDDMAIHVLASSTVNAFAETVLHRMDKQEALIFISNIQEFFHFGFMHMLGLPCDHE